MHSVVVGLGKTGASCVRYLVKRGDRVSATDSRRAPPGLAELGELAAAVDLRLGGFDQSLLEGASQVLMSPGVSLEEPIARAARARGIEVLGGCGIIRARSACPGDRHHRHQWQEHRDHLGGAHGGRRRQEGLGRRQSRRAGARSARTDPNRICTCSNCRAFNWKPPPRWCCRPPWCSTSRADHLDRYPSVEAYSQAKSRIFANASTVVLNADDPWVMAMRDTRYRSPAARILTFSIERSRCRFHADPQRCAKFSWRAAARNCSTSHA